MIGGLQSSTYYEICLAVVEHVTVYYIHRDLCREVKTVSTTENVKKTSNFISTKNVTVVPSQNSVTLTWQIQVENNEENSGNAKEMISVIRQISVRKFGSDNTTQLFVLEDFNKTALLANTTEKDSSR